MVAAGCRFCRRRGSDRRGGPGGNGDRSRPLDQPLRKPSWEPPDWLFGPAWTLIFALAALSGYLAWRSMPDLAGWARIVGLFSVNGILNILWSVLFFGLHRPDWALAEVAALWLSILALIIVIAPYSKPASVLLLPYLVWVAFAAVLNLAVVQLNVPLPRA